MQHGNRAGAWSDVANTLGQRTISPVGLGKEKHTYVVWRKLLPCRKGTLGTAAQGGGTLNGKSVQSGWKYSQVVSNPRG